MGVNNFGWRRYGSLSLSSSLAVLVLVLVFNLPSARSGKCAKIRKIESLGLMCGFSFSKKGKTLQVFFTKVKEITKVTSIIEWLTN